MKVGDVVALEPAPDRHRDRQGDRRAAEPLRGHRGHAARQRRRRDRGATSRSSPSTSAGTRVPPRPPPVPRPPAEQDAAVDEGAPGGPDRLRRRERGCRRPPVSTVARARDDAARSVAHRSVETAVAATPALAPRSTPPVRLYAKQHGVDLATRDGTGRDGLITRDDVERALAGAPWPRRRPSAPIDRAEHDVALRRARARVVGRRPEPRSASRSRACCDRWLTRWSRARSARPTPRCGCASTRRAPSSCWTR